MTKTLEEIEAETEAWIAEQRAEDSDDKGKTVIYISGKMSGLPQFGFPAFFEAEEKLRSMGYEVINPARLDSENGFDGSGIPTPEWVAEARRRDVEELQERADALCVLPGWDDNSVGARAEMYLAFWEGIPVYEYPSMRELTWAETVKTGADVKKVESTFCTCDGNDSCCASEPTPHKATVLPENDSERKAIDPWKFFLCYFPRAIVEVTKVSQQGCGQHDTDGWDRSKSPNELGSAGRHMLDFTVDPDNIGLCAQIAWRWLAHLQKMCEKRVDS